MNRLWVHGGVFVVAAALGLAVWLRDEPAGTEIGAERVEVWAGSPDAVRSVRFESKKRTVVLEAKKDSEGRYYITSVDKEEGPSHRDPHGHDKSADAGAPETPPKRVQQRFIGVKAADELAKQIAPLTALRKVGAIDPKRAEEFGLDEPEGTLKVNIGGREHALVIGGTTPGGQERYARHVQSNTVYAVPGDIAQSLMSAESRLLERDLHGFENEDVTRVRVTKGGKSRELVESTDKKGGWADAATPAKLDETAGNWMTKLERLRVQEYVEKPSSPLRPEEAVVRVEYFAGTKPLGFLELYKQTSGQETEYLVKSERTRWTAKVLKSAAEQVDQDLASVLK